MKRLGELLKSKTVIGAVVAIFGPLVVQYVGIDAAGLAEIMQALGSILFVVGARDAVRKIG